MIASFAERVVELIRSGRSVAAVCAELGLAEATVYRWKAQDLIDRGEGPGNRSVERGELAAARRRIRELETELELVRKAAAFEAHRAATGRQARDHRRRVETNEELGQLVAELLAQRRSPQQISRHLRSRFAAESGMWLCHESIYQAIYQPGSVLARPSPLAPHRRSPLRTGRDHRRAHQRGKRRRPRFQQLMLTIHQRPFGPTDRWSGPRMLDSVIEPYAVVLVWARYSSGLR
jgi:IS30 family transposase